MRNRPAAYKSCAAGQTGVCDKHVCDASRRRNDVQMWWRECGQAHSLEAVLAVRSEEVHVPADDPTYPSSLPCIAIVSLEPQIDEPRSKHSFQLSTTDVDLY